MCGYVRVGSEIANAFKDGKTPFVVIDINEQSLQRAANDGCVVVHGDAAESDTLRAAGVDRARGLVAAIDSDEEWRWLLALWGRRLVGDTLLVARTALRHGHLDRAEEAKVEPVFSELMGAHARRMDAMGLAA